MESRRITSSPYRAIAGGAEGKERTATGVAESDDDMKMKLFGSKSIKTYQPHDITATRSGDTPVAHKQSP